MTALLAVRDLHVAYGKIEAVTGVSLDMQAGQIVTVIGPNGAGKTTLLAALMGLLPSRGETRYQDGDIGALNTEERVRRGISPGAGAARAVHRDDGRGQPDPRRLHALARPRRLAARSCRMCSRASRGWPSGAASSPAPCPAASGRCWRSAAR